MSIYIYIYIYIYVYTVFKESDLGDIEEELGVKFKLLLAITYVLLLRFLVLAGTTIFFVNDRVIHPFKKKKT